MNVFNGHTGSKKLINKYCIIYQGTLEKSGEKQGKVGIEKLGKVEKIRKTEDRKMGKSGEKQGKVGKSRDQKVGKKEKKWGQSGDKK